MIKITYDSEKVEDFLRFRIYISDSDIPKNVKISAVLYLKSGKEYVFMPDVTSLNHDTTYPEKSVNYLTRVGKGEYQFFFYQGDERPVTLRVFAGIDDVVVDKSFRINQ